METLLDFFKSDLGVGIAWVCTVGSVIYSVFKRQENKTLLQKIELNETNISIDEGQDTVTQKGGGNVYTKHNSGGMKIDM